MLNLSQMQHALNRAANTADQTNVLQHEVVDRLIERLPLIRLEPECILQCGVRGDYLTKLLFQQYSDVKVVTLDCADQQLAKLSNMPCLQVASHYTALPIGNDTVDMVISSLCLNGTNDLATCFREFRRVLKPNGVVIFTLLGVETLKELRQSFSSCHEFLHRFPDMHDVGDLLLQSGFEDPVVDMEMITVRYKALNTLFQDLKISGSGNAHQKRPKGLFGKYRWALALKKYQTLKEDGAYPASFEIIYGHAWQPGRRNNDAIQEVGIPIDQVQY